MNDSQIAPLPHPLTEKGDPRLVGIEIELGGLKEDEVAAIIADTFSGTLKERDGKTNVETARLGDLQVYLDTRYRETLDDLGDLAKDIAGAVVPVEIVTQPLDPALIETLDTLVGRLRQHGAKGTEDGMVLGFGVHLNPQVRSTRLEHCLPVLTAFALLEDHMRETNPIDTSRRALPFVRAYPTGLIDALVMSPPDSFDALIDLYAQHAPSRNHALDMTCLLAEVDMARLSQRMDRTGIKPRPTFHYRLPDFRPSDPDWSLALEWNRWVQVEAISEDATLMTALQDGWRAHRDQVFVTRKGWSDKVATILADHQEGRAA